MGVFIHIFLVMDLEMVVGMASNIIDHFWYCFYPLYDDIDFYSEKVNAECLTTRGIIRF